MDTKLRIREVIRTLMESPYYFDPLRGHTPPERLALVKRMLAVIRRKSKLEQGLSGNI